MPTTATQSVSPNCWHSASGRVIRPAVSKESRFMPPKALVSSAVRSGSPNANSSIRAA
jgi:hypothetical protein